MSYLFRERLGYFQPGANDFHVLFWRDNSALALLLEAVQDKHRLLELHGVDGTIRSADIVFDYLQDTGTSEAFEHFRRVVLPAVLGEVQGVTEELPYVGGERHQVFFATSEPHERLFFVGHWDDI